MRPAGRPGVMRRVIALLAALALALMACGGGAATPPPSGGGMVDADADWRLVEGTHADEPIPLVAGADITMTVAGTQVSGRSACNLYGGEIVVVDGQLRFGQMMSTDMACDGPVMASEAMYLAAMAEVRAASRDGDRLTLTGPGVELVFERLEPPPTAAMIGTTWVLDSLITADAVSSVMGDPATLVLDADGSFRGSTGCRSFTGRYRELNAEIVFAEFAMDGAECPEDLAAQDGHVVSVLGDGFRAAVDGRRLTLTGAGNQGLGYHADDE
jgi:heat shock protein HslJ